MCKIEWDYTIFLFLCSVIHKNILYKYVLTKIFVFFTFFYRATMNIPSSSEDELDSENELSCEEEDEDQTTENPIEEDVWRRPETSRSYDPETTKWIGALSFSEEILALEDPLSTFDYFLPDEILDFIVVESNHFAEEKNKERPLNLTRSELKKFIGSVLWPRHHQKGIYLQQVGRNKI